MPILDLDTDAHAMIINNIVVTIATVHNLIIFSYHCIIVSKYLKASGRIPLLSLFPLTTHCLITLYTAVFYDWDMHLLTCEWTIKLGHILYAIAKNSIYLFYAERLFAVFENSQMAFKKSTILITRIAWIIWSLYLFTFSLFADTGYYDTNTKRCTATMGGIENAIAGLIDLIICVTLSVLFVRRMLAVVFMIGDTDKAMEMSRSGSGSTSTTGKNTDIDESTKNDNKQMHESMQNLSTLKILRKTTLLAFIGLLTTQLSLVFASVFGMDGMFTCIDWMINCYCVILMFAKYKKVYVKLCHCNRMELCFTMNCLACYSCHCCCAIAPKKVTPTNLVTMQSTSSIEPPKSDVESIDS
eukprot:247122_1